MIRKRTKETPSGKERTAPNLGTAAKTMMLPPLPPTAVKALSFTPLTVKALVWALADAAGRRQVNKTEDQQADTTVVLLN